MRYCLYYLFLSATLLLISSCDEDDTVSPPETNTNSDLFGIEASTSPVNLEDVPGTFYADIPYDNDTATVFDIFIPDVDTPSPAVIFIHGGGFISGDKSQSYNDNWRDIKNSLRLRYAYISINYRFIETNDPVGVRKPMYDIKRALQFIRHHADSLNINPDRIGAYGSSAGAGAALWLAFRDDMADAGNSDPVLRESTRLTVAAAKATQATYDIVRWFDLVFKDFDVTLSMLPTSLTQRLLDFYAISDTSELFLPEIVNYRAEMNMLSQISVDDPPVWIENNQEEGGFTLQSGQFFHHPLHAEILDSICDEVGVLNRVYAPAIQLADPTGEELLPFFLENL